MRSKPDFKNIRIELLPVAELYSYPGNPRTWTPTQLAQLKESIRRNGWLEPIVVNRAAGSLNVILGGNMRFCAAKELGYTEIPAICVNVKDKKKEKEIVLRLNKNTGSWDVEKLKEFDVSFLLEIGFDDGDLDKIWDEILETEDDGFDVAKELEAIKKPKTKPGQLFMLGNHRLLCGDAMDPKDVQRLLAKTKPDMVYLDPPYNITLDYNKGVGGGMRYGGTTKDNKSKEEYAVFLRTAFENAVREAKPDCHFFCYCDHSYVGLLHTLFTEVGLKPQRTCLWVKNNMNVTLEVAFSKCYEPCVYGIRGKPYLNKNIRNVTEILNKEIGSGNRAVDDILDLLDIWLAHRIHNSQYEHPTEKPPTLHEKPLRRCTKPGDVVLDLFGGSGSTLIACEQLKRRAFLMEIEPVFCDLIIRRFEALTGLKASLIQS